MYSFGQVPVISAFVLVTTANIAVCHILLKIDSLGYIFAVDIIGLSSTT